jgi:DNA-binding response OmpR family regulator
LAPPAARSGLADRQRTAIRAALNCGMTRTHKPVIVYVEDNTGDALLLREALIENDHDVELMVIESGDMAMHYFEVKAGARDVPPPHCILLDANLPMVTGIELVKFIRGVEIFDHTPVFLFASPAEYAKIKTTVDIAPDSFLKKPRDWDQFRLLADTLMRGAWRNIDAPTLQPEAAADPADELRRF